MREIIGGSIIFIIVIAIIAWLSAGAIADSTQLQPVQGITTKKYSCYGRVTATSGSGMYETAGADCQLSTTDYTTQCNANDVAVGVKYRYSSYRDDWGILHTGASCYSLCQNMSLDQSTCNWR